MCFLYYRTRPVSAGTKKVPGIITTTNPSSNGVRDSVVRRKNLFFFFFFSKYLIDTANAWTITSTSNGGRSIINGSFSGEVDIPGQDNAEIINRVDQLEKEIKGRDAEIRELTARVKRFLESFFVFNLFYLNSFVI
jgi:hypothetical protein